MHAGVSLTVVTSDERYPQSLRVDITEIDKRGEEKKKEVLLVRYCLKHWPGKCFQ